MTTREKVFTGFMSVLMAAGLFGLLQLCRYCEKQPVDEVTYYGLASPDDTTRDYAYEAYCDSIYENDTMYYIDVLTETSEYQEYLEQHGVWW